MYAEAHKYHQPTTHQPTTVAALSLLGGGWQGTGARQRFGGGGKVMLCVELSHNAQ